MKIEKLLEDIGLEFKIIDEDQFKVCVFQNTHNLMRLQRVFASLSVLG